MSQVLLLSSSENQTLAASDFAAMLTQARNSVCAPYQDQLLHYCQQLSETIFDDAVLGNIPEMLALASFLRRSSTHAWQQQFKSGLSAGVTPVARGLVFHIAPGNVDLLFAYSWLFSFLSGNANVVRISSKSADETKKLCELMSGLEKVHPLVPKTHIVQFEHSESTNSILSGHADVRVIWGGDETIQKIRAVAIGPRAIEIAFADRHSLSLVCAKAVLELTETKLNNLAADLFRDLYAFDQGACSSPRLMIWLADSDEQANRASQLLLGALDRVAQERGYICPSGAAMEKFLFSCQSVIDQKIASVKKVSERLTVLRLAELQKIPASHCGFGLLFEWQCRAWDEISSHLDEKLQTISYFGIDSQRLQDLTALVQNTGVDRIVPIGQALNFHRFWDGYDLLYSFVRFVHRI